MRFLSQHQHFDHDSPCKWDATPCDNVIKNSSQTTNAATPRYATAISHARKYNDTATIKWLSALLSTSHADERDYRVANSPERWYSDAQHAL